jgi:phospho-N-acetylmuramoyl-pentapeptide-transferase
VNPNTMLRSLTEFTVAFALGLALSRVFRRSLFWLRSRERKPGKEKIHRLFPKPRRPLGGGLAMMIAATAALLLAPLVWGGAPRGETLVVLPIAWAYAVIGLFDDLRKAGGRGLRERPKFLLQLGAALLFGLLLWGVGGRDELRLPFVADPAPIGPFYALVAALVILSTANAVNLSDGMDGLAGGGLVIALAGLAAIGYLEPTRAVGPIVWPLCGATLGFLLFNLPPARLLMGDTGALGMGAALGAAAIVAQAELWLPLLAAPFVVNAASVIVQMGAVRGLWRVVKPLRHSRTETARPFLCTPLHHHFQWLAWPDRRILALYWGFGAAMALWALLSLHSGLVWLVGAALIPGFLVVAAAQKLLRGSYFIGLVERPDGPAIVALYCGLPLEVMGWRLHRPVTETTITESMLVGATAESILWRPVSELEARIILGRIYADQRLLDEALAEWEQVPMRNLLLRPSVMLRMARIYYGRDRLLEAIKLWEQLPGERLAEMPNVREVVRSAKLRLAEVANKSHRQAIRLGGQRRRTPEDAERVEAHLSAARRLNQELLSLLLYESGKLRGRAADPEAARARREMLRHSRDVVLGRIHQLDEALAELARTTPGPAAEAERQAADPAQRAAAELGLSRADLLRVLMRAGQGEPEIIQVAVHPKASRNTVYRLGVRWPGGGPASVIAKLYAADRVDFFSACYRREEGVLRLLGQYGAAVPRVYAGELWEDRGLLLLQDLGDETLAERLEASEPAVRRQWLRSAVSALVALHSIGQAHLRELAAEISKLEKEVLRPEYYLNALRIAVTRISELADTPMGESDWERLAEQARPLVDLLSERRQGFIHFEFTPHHLLVTDASAQAGGSPLASGETRAGGLSAFDFEQATIGPLEFDLATLLVQPESDLGGPSGALGGALGVLRGAVAPEWEPLIEQYYATASESGIALAAREEFERGVAYAALLKCLGYAGAAANFLAKFGGEYHLQRLHHYLNTCQGLMQRWPPLRPLGQLLAPRFRAARATGAHGGPPAREQTAG